MAEHYSSVWRDDILFSILQLRHLGGSHCLDIVNMHIAVQVFVSPYCFLGAVSCLTCPGVVMWRLQMNPSYHLGLLPLPSAPTLWLRCLPMQAGCSAKPVPFMEHLLWKDPLHRVLGGI
jgi:hypothetical protein